MFLKAYIYELSALRADSFDGIDGIYPPASPERERWRAGMIFLLKFRILFIY